MTDTTTIAPAETYQPSLPLPSPEPAADRESAREEIRQLVREAASERDETPRALQVEEGKPRSSYPDALTAARAVSRARREKDEAAPAEASVEPFIDPIHYQDRAPDAEVDAKTAAKDLTEYRATKAAYLRQQLGIDPPAEAPPEQAAPEPSQPEPQPAPEPPLTDAEQDRRTLAAGG